MRNGTILSLAVLTSLAISCRRNPPAVDGDPNAPLLAEVERTPEVTNGLGMRFVAVRPGTFRMGSPAEEAGRDTGEDLREVRIERPFYLAVHEVTQKQWAAVMDAHPSRFKGDDHPVEQVSLEDARDFARRLSERDGVAYRLPTEAEWEYACRAGATTAYSTGARLVPRDANVRLGPADGLPTPTGARHGTTPVGTYSANPWGLFDMHGNVWEWTAEGLLRGGAWSFSAAAARCAARLHLAPGTRYDVTGVRLVREVGVR